MQKIQKKLSQVRLEAQHIVQILGSDQLNVLKLNKSMDVNP